MAFKRPLFWLTLLGVLAVFAARQGGSLTPVRDPAWRARAWRTTRVEGMLAGPVRRTRRGWRILLDFASASGTQRAVLWLPKGFDVAACAPGRAASVWGRLRPTRPARDPGAFDEEAAEAARGAAWVLEAREVDASSETPSARFWLQDWAQGARLGAEARFARLLEPRRAALLSALAFGEGGGLGDATARAVRDAGGMHLLAASGLKVGFVAGLAALLAALLGLRPGARAAAAVAAAGFYALMAGGEAPSARAWLMLSAAALSRALDRPVAPSAVLTLAAAILLAWNPRAALSVGALLSFGGCAAILAAAPRAEALIPRAWPRPGRRALSTLLAGAVMTAALWPLFAGIFLRESVIGPLANVALIPLAGLLLYGACLLAVLPGAAAAWAARGVDAGLGLFETVCRAACRAPFAAVAARPWSAGEWAAYCFLAAAFLAWPRRRWTAALALSAAGIYGGAPLLSPPPPVAVVYLSRPAGAALLRFSGGRAWYAGPKPPGYAARRAALALGAAPIERAIVGRSWEVRLGRVVLRLGDPSGPAVREGRGPFATIGRPRARAIEANTDGSVLFIRSLPPRLFRGPDLPQRVQAGFGADASASARPAEV